MRIRRLPALGGQRLLDPVVGLGDQLGGLRVAIGDGGLDAVQQVDVGHGIDILGIDLQGDLEHAEALFDLRPVLRSHALP